MLSGVPLLEIWILGSPTTQTCHRKPPQRLETGKRRLPEHLLLTLTFKRVRLQWACLQWPHMRALPEPCHDVLVGSLYPIKNWAMGRAQSKILISNLQPRHRRFTDMKCAQELELRKAQVSSYTPDSPCRGFISCSMSLRFSHAAS